VTRIPCKHPCAVIRFMHQSIVNYVDYHMTMEAFKLSYAPILLALVVVPAMVAHRVVVLGLTPGSPVSLGYIAQAI